MKAHHPQDNSLPFIAYLQVQIKKKKKNLKRGFNFDYQFIKSFFFFFFIVCQTRSQQQPVYESSDGRVYKPFEPNPAAVMPAAIHRCRCPHSLIIISSIFDPSEPLFCLFSYSLPSLILLLLVSFHLYSLFSILLLSLFFPSFL
jgi:hypothetical protein